MSDLNEQKLTLEIQELQIKNRWEPLTRFMPVFAAVIAGVGLFVSVVKYQKDQEAQQTQVVGEQQKDRANREAELKLRFQNQIRADFDQILQFTHDQNQTVARASFLLEDISTLLASKVDDKQTVSDVFPNSKETVTRSLVYVIAYDCDFMSKPRDVGFAQMVVGRWNDYAAYLVKDTDKYNFILYKYVRALRDLTDRHPDYFHSMKYDPPTDDFVVLPKYEQQAGEEQRYQHFLDIIQGFKSHVDAIGNNPAPTLKAIRDKNVRQFEEALCNAEISKVILGPHFTNKPCEAD